MYSAFDSYFIYISFIPLIYISVRLTRRTHWILPMLVILLYAFLMGFRYNVGIDWMQFKSAYQDLVKDTSNVARTYEPFYTLVCTFFAKTLGLHYTSIFVLETFLYLFAIFLFCRLCPDDQSAAVACTIYYCISFFHAINTSRNFFAISLILIGSYLLLKNDDKKWSLVFMLCGALTHYATLPFIFLFWGLYYYQPKPKFKILLLIYLVIFAVFRLNIEILTSHIYEWMKVLSSVTGEQRFDVYTNLNFLSADSEHVYTLSILRTTVFVILNIVFLYLACKRYKTLDSRMYKVIYWCAIVYVLITNSFQIYEILYRFTYVLEAMFCFVIGDFIVSKPVKRSKSDINWMKVYGVMYTLLMIYQFIVDIRVKLTTHGIYFYYKLIDNLDTILL